MDALEERRRAAARVFVDERNPYLEQAAPDLATALRGPVGSRILDGKLASSIFDVVARSTKRGRHQTYSSAWLALTTHDAAPCAVITSTSFASERWSPESQRYDEIEHIELSSKPTEPGRFAIVDVAHLPDRAEFRPFLLTIERPLWYPESIWDDTICPAIYAQIEKRPASPDGMILGEPTYNADSGELEDGRERAGILPSMGRVLIAPRRYRIDGPKIKASRIVMRRLRRARGLEPFQGHLDVTVTRDAIRAFFATDLHAAIALAADHAPDLRLGLGRAGCP